MNNDKKSTNANLIIEFLTKIIDVNNNKQELFDNRASIMLAANAILLAGITGFGIPLVESNITNQWAWSTIALVVVSLLLSIVSTLSIGQLIAPLAITQRGRQKYLDMELPELNVFFFLKIAEYKKKEYSDIVKGLSDEQVIDQLLSEVHNTSKLLSIRVTRLRRAYLSFISSIIAFALLGMISLLI